MKTKWRKYFLTFTVNPVAFHPTTSQEGVIESLVEYTDLLFLC